MSTLRRLLVVLTVLFTFLASHAQAQLTRTEQPSPATNLLRDVWAIDASNIWVAGADGRILKSYGSSTWMTQTSGAVRLMNEVFAQLWLEQHLDKTFMSRVSRGFEFLGVDFQFAEPLAASVVVSPTRQRKSPGFMSKVPRQSASGDTKRIGKDGLTASLTNRIKPRSQSLPSTVCATKRTRAMIRLMPLTPRHDGAGEYIK